MQSILLIAAAVRRFLIPPKDAEAEIIARENAEHSPNRRRRAAIFY